MYCVCAGALEMGMFEWESLQFSFSSWADSCQGGSSVSTSHLYRLHVVWLLLQQLWRRENLNTGCTPRIIHSDIKSENILLIKTMVAKVADFGLSMLGADQDINWKTYVTTKVVHAPIWRRPSKHVECSRSPQKSTID
ncbi:hypothetical protein M758_8G181500 [Ceratodon purpureus]|nr:hypothetical protein M758_8G181500 [Ceratodon purpureus]